MADRFSPVAFHLPNFRPGRFDVKHLDTRIINAIAAERVKATEPDYPHRGLDIPPLPEDHTVIHSTRQRAELEPEWEDPLSTARGIAFGVIGSLGIIALALLVVVLWG